MHNRQHSSLPPVLVSITVVGVRVRREGPLPLVVEGLPLVPPVRIGLLPRPRPSCIVVQSPPVLEKQTHGRARRGVDCKHSCHPCSPPSSTDGRRHLTVWGAFDCQARVAARRGCGGHAATPGTSCSIVFASQVTAHHLLMHEYPYRVLYCAISHRVPYIYPSLSRWSKFGRASSRGSVLIVLMPSFRKRTTIGSLPSDSSACTYSPRRPISLGRLEVGCKGLYRLLHTPQPAGCLRELGCAYEGTKAGAKYTSTKIPFTYSSRGIKTRDLSTFLNIFLIY